MKKVLMTMLTAGLAFAMINTSGTANAEENGDSSQEETSEASVKFTPPEEFENVSPLNPINPDDSEYEPRPGEGTIPDASSKTSGLTIDYISNIQFGDSNELSLNEQTINSTTNHPYIQITDQRFTEAGWNLTAKASSFFLVENNERTSKQTLHGAQIHFKNGDNTTKEDLLSNKNIMKPNVNNSIELATNGASDIVASALSKEKRGDNDKLQGLGTWLITWLAGEDYAKNGNEKVVLKIPTASSTAGEHSSIITWTLTDGPAKNHSDIQE